MKKRGEGKRAARYREPRSFRARGLGLCYASSLFAFFALFLLLSLFFRPLGFPFFARSLARSRGVSNCPFIGGFLFYSPLSLCRSLFHWRTPMLLVFIHYSFLLFSFRDSGRFLRSLADCCGIALSLARVLSTTAYYRRYFNTFAVLEVPSAAAEIDYFDER